MRTHFGTLRCREAILMVFVAAILCIVLLSGCAEDTGDPVENEFCAVCGEKGPFYPFTDNDGVYHLVIPADWNVDSLAFFARTDAYTFTFNGASVGTEAVSIPVTEDEICTLTVTDAKRKTVTEAALIVSRSRIPSLCINTASGSMDAVHADKTYREEGTAAVTLPDGTEEYNGDLSWIHGHGNSSWNMHKKSYSIKFPQKINVLGLEGKKFCLIANGADYSSLRNWVVYKSLLETELPGSVDCAHTALWINGRFYGLYLVTEKIGIGKNSIPITGQKEPILDGTEKYVTRGKNGAPGSVKSLNIHSPEDADITGGYLLELFEADRYEAETNGFVSKNGQHVVINSPENPTVEQMNYISGLYQEIEDALLAPDGINPNTGRHYSDYIDVKSFALMYLYEEMTQDIDAGEYSIFLYKDKDTVDGKVYGGPLWDFDLSLGNELGYTPYGDPSWPVSLTYRHGRTELLWELRERKDFTDMAAALYHDEIRGLFTDYVQGDVLRNMSETLRHDAKLDDIRWMRGNEYQQQVDELTAYADAHLAFLDEYLGHEDEYITVSADTGKGLVRKSGVYFYAVKPGETVDLPDDEETEADFLGWYVDGTNERFDPDAPLYESVSVTAHRKMNLKKELVDFARAVYHRLMPYLPLLCALAAIVTAGAMYLIVRHKKKKGTQERVTMRVG